MRLGKEERDMKEREARKGRERDEGEGGEMEQRASPSPEKMVEMREKSILPSF